MKKYLTAGRFLLPSLFAGLLGFLLQLWLLTTTDDRGLLAHFHISSILTFLLTGVFLLVLALYVRKQTSVISYPAMFAGGVVPAIGCLAAAGGILYTAIHAVTVRKDILTWLVLGVGILAALCLLVLALFRLRKQRPHGLLQGIVTFFFAVYLLNQYRSWCKEPQLVVVFFPLLACIFLMLALYHGTALDTQKESCHRYVFFNRAAVVCCCLALCHGNSIFYAAMGLYMACSLRLFPAAAKRRTTDSEE